MQNANIKVVRRNFDSKEQINQKIINFLNNSDLINIHSDHLRTKI